ncbi:hypothetical protein C6496_23180 [Candidatus Poribacteria bacterium]|nr:MAG: hypothetical protein C6496_23180 [Candidatus Poribacteria bacterium]
MFNRFSFYASRFAFYATVFVLILSIFAVSAPAQNAPPEELKTFTLDKEGNVFMFGGSRFRAATERINGSIALAPDALHKTFKAMFQLDMKRLKIETVIDNGIQKVVWNADVYPQAILRIESLNVAEDVRLVDALPIIADAEATFEFHGVKKPVKLKELRFTYFSRNSRFVQWLPGDVLRLVGGFEIQSADYNVETKPKLTTPIPLNFSLFAVDAAEGVALPTELINGYLRVPFNFLGDYWLDEPDWRRLADSEYIASLSYEAEIPDEVKQIDGKKVAITGFMLPIDVDKGKVQRFLLLKSTMSCCFGVAPRINEVIYVESSKKQKIQTVMDMPITVFGKLSVGQQFREDLMLMGVYQLELDEVKRAR